MLQSLPFVLIGVFASGLVQQRLSAETLTRWLPQRRLAVVLLSSVFGFAAPVCDCGVIPLARRLGAKGLPAYAATTFILAAPVVNPVVLVSTAFAFQGNWAIVGLRMAMTLSVAIAVGLAASTLSAGLSSLVPYAGPFVVDAIITLGGSAQVLAGALLELFDDLLCFGILLDQDELLSVG